MHIHYTPIAALCVIALLSFGSIVVIAQNNHDDEGSEDDEFTTEFMIGDCAFKDSGANPYFSLQPGYQLILESEDEKVVITALREKKRFAVQGLGKPSIRTRVIEERHYEHDELVELSRNFFAICKQTNDVFYFGEDVNNYEEGSLINHDGSWHAFKDGAKPGIIMPGRFLLGSAYFQEQAPGAMDRAEHEAMGLTVETEAGTFDDCVMIEESSPLEPNATSEKTYCPGIGLVLDDDLKLVDFGMANSH